eukprot:9104949-Prorocentrum_lima.AAC.1
MIKLRGILLSLEDQEDAEEADGSVMQVQILPPGDDGHVEHQFNSSTIPKLGNPEDEWGWRGT